MATVHSKLQKLGEVGKGEGGEGEVEKGGEGEERWGKEGGGGVVEKRGEGVEERWEKEGGSRLTCTQQTFLNTISIGQPALMSTKSTFT